MANATPVHPTTPEDAPKAPKAKPAAKKSDGPTKVDMHIPAEPGNYYELPDGTVVSDH
jgi:hypothetical protein